MKVYCFAEPHVTGGVAFVEITEEQIRNWMKKAYPMVEEEHQIVEFCAIYWAWEKKPLTADEIVSVQPMTVPSGLVFEYVYEESEE